MEARIQRYLFIIFDKMEIDGTVLDGFYYHDADGCYLAASPHMVKISKLTCMGTDETGEPAEYTFDGYYMVNNLGKLSAAPRGEIYRWSDNGVGRPLTAIIILMRQDGW